MRGFLIFISYSRSPFLRMHGMRHKTRDHDGCFCADMFLEGCSVVGSMHLPMHGFGEKANGDDDASLGSGMSGDTLMGEKRERWGGEFVKRLLRRKGGEGGGNK